MHSLWIMHGFTLDNTISILLQWAACSVYSVLSLAAAAGKALGHQPMVICYL